MTKGKVLELYNPAENRDVLTEFLRDGARDLIRVALENEIRSLLLKFEGEKLEDGKPRVVRNGYLPERTIQTGIGEVEVKVPRVRARAGEGVKFESLLVPRYLRKTRSMEELLPWLYLKGISTNDFQEALASILGKEAKGLSSSTVVRLKAEWEKELHTWQGRDLSKKRYPYIWVDGIHTAIRGSDSRLCLLVVFGVTDKGHKELVAIAEGYRESEESWATVLRDLHTRGLTVAPELATGDGALGFWKAIRDVYPKTKHQRCWHHKINNVLDKLPKSLQPQAKDALQQIWMANLKNDALKAWNVFEARFKDKYPKAVETLNKDKESMLRFFDFPAVHWRSIRTTNPIESIFATVRHRSSRTKGAVSRESMTVFAFKLIMSAQQRLHRLRGFEHLADVISEVDFKDGVKDDGSSENLDNSQQEMAA
jgi:transposase-like protein